MAKRYLTALSMVFCVMGVLVGCLRSTGETARQVPLTVLYQSTQCGTDSPRFSASWFSRPEQLRNGISSGRFAGDGWDAQTTGALLLHMGMRRTGGYHLRLDQPTANIENGTATVTVRMQAPDPGRFTTQVITSPCLLLTMPKSGLERIEIRDQEGDVLTQIQVPASPNP